MKVDHSGVDIVYNEASNKWEAVIRDRHRTFDSLAKAKEAIDSHPKTKAGLVEKFEPVPVLKVEYRGAILEGKITSYCEPRYGKNINEAWTNFGGTRGKDNFYCLYPDTPEVRAALMEAKSLEDQANELTSKAREIRSGRQLKEIAP